MEARALWIVTPEYTNEAALSAFSVDRAMPKVKREIIEAKNPQHRQHKEWFVESIRLLNEYLKNVPDGTRLLWLDSDTYMAEAVPELFGMLEQFDMALAHAPGRRTAPTRQPVPDSFPEFNIGVVVMWANDKLRGFWRDVYRHQTDFLSVYGDNDQAPLRELLYYNDALRVATLPQEYNCRFRFGCQVRDRVKILHGRIRPWTAEVLDKVAAEINQAYVDGYQVPPHYWFPGPPGNGGRN